MALFRVLITAVLTASSFHVTQAADWGQFRGTNANGVADNQNLPDQWDTKSNTNIRWKKEIPGLGHASPIITGNLIFIVTAENGETKPPLRVGLYGDIASVQNEDFVAWKAFCLSKTDGRVIWSRTLRQGKPKVKRHTKASHANSTPATDGKHLVVFLGSEGLFCLDLCGNVIWNRDFGLLDSGYYKSPKAQWGFASSPIIYKNMVIVQCDVQKDSFLAAYDIRNGRQLWKTPRVEVPTWSTPAIHEGSERAELIVNGYKHTGGYDPFTGNELWKLSGGGDIPVPTPVMADDLIFLTSAHGKERPLYAIREGASGELSLDETETNQHVAWHAPRVGNYMQTPLVYGDYLYGCLDNGVLSCFNARTGAQIYRERLGGGTGFTASPVASDGKLYFPNENGEIYIVEAGPEYRLLGTSQMHDVCMATPAISDGAIYIRTASSVVCISNPTHSKCKDRKKRLVRLRSIFRHRSNRRQ